MPNKTSKEILNRRRSLKISKNIEKVIWSVLSGRQTSFRPHIVVNTVAEKKS